MLLKNLRNMPLLTSISWMVRSHAIVSNFEATADNLGSIGINDALIGKLTDGLPEQYLQGLKELYINFHGAFLRFALPPSEHEALILHSVALEPRVFSTKTPYTFMSLYGPPEGRPEDGMQRWEDDIGWMSRSVRPLAFSFGLHRQRAHSLKCADCELARYSRRIPFDSILQSSKFFPFSSRTRSCSWGIDRKAVSGSSTAGD